MTKRRKVELTEAAKGDIVRLHQDDPQLARIALLRLRDLGRGDLTGQPLEEMAVTGDLTDSRKLYFGTGDEPTHRVVYREHGPRGGIEVLDVVAVEERDELYAYLLAAVRLGRLPEESRSRLNRVRQRVIQRRAGTRRPREG